MLTISDVDNSNAYIDSRNITKVLQEFVGAEERLAEIDMRLEEISEEYDADEWEELQIERDDLLETLEDDDLKELKAFADEGESLFSEWNSGVTLIREDSFTEHAQQLAEDIGAIDPKAFWPLNRINWEGAAEDLKADYTAIEYGNDTYWGRAC